MDVDVRGEKGTERWREGGGKRSKVMEGVMCCRGKLRGRLGVYDRLSERKRERDRQSER